MLKAMKHGVPVRQFVEELMEKGVRFATGMSDSEAVETATSGNPLWGSYGKTLAELAKRYGGGHQVPLLHKLDAFSKKHGENKRLGEEFLAAVVSSFKYPDPSIVLPRVVDMLLTTTWLPRRLSTGLRGASQKPTLPR